MKNALITLFLNFAGPVTLLAFLAWIYSVRKVVVGWKKEWWISGALALFCGVVAFTATTVSFKVLSDETNLLSVANMLALFGKASNTEMWVYYYHTFHALDVSVPSRPILFPLLTALIHLLIGVRPASPFVVNFLCFTGLVFLALEWGRKQLPQWGRVLTALCLMMSPVLLIVSTSAGFDLSALFFAFVAFLLLKRYEQEKSEDLLNAFILTLVCFASIRYESIVALPLGAVAVWWIGRRVPVKLYALAFFLVLPIFVQRFLTWGSFENPPDVPAFSPMHFAKYFPIFLKAFFIDGRGPYPVVIHWLGLGGLALAFLKPARSSVVAGVYGIFLFFLLLSHHFGLSDHPTQVRLFLPLTFGLSLAAIHFLSRYPLDTRALLAVFAVLTVHHHHYVALDPLSTQLTMTREVRHVRDFLSEHADMGELFVYDRPGQIAALGRSAMSWVHFTAHKDDLLGNLKNRLYQSFYFVEKVRYDKPEEKKVIPPGFALTYLEEHQLSPEEKLRISRLAPIMATP